MSFGSRLDEAITMRGITQRKFAKMVGISEVSISRYISGERNPKMPTAIKMADILNVSLDWLAIDESERKVGKKADVIEAYQRGWNDAIDAMQNAKFVSVADHKTENSSEKPNNCEECEHWNDAEDGCADRHGCKTEPTISKMEQVDEPQTEVDWKQRLCDMYGADRKSFDEAWRKYEADKVKDEPQTERSE